MTPKIALCGAGIFARKQHVPAIQQADIDLVAVFSRSQHSASSLVADLQLNNVSIYAEDFSETLDDLLSRSDLDAVVLALPIVQQADVVRRCLAAGKHVLSEKPIAKDVATAKRLLIDHEGSGSAARWIVAEQLGYEEALQAAAALVQIGKIGKIRSFSLDFMRFVGEDSPYYNTAWRRVPDYQGGFLLDGGVHLFAALRILFSDLSALQQASWPPSRLSAFARLTLPRLAPLDTLHAILSLPSPNDNPANEIQGTVTITFAAEANVSPERPLVTIYGSEGTLEVSQDRNGWTNVLQRKGEEVQRTTYESKGVANEIRAFADALASGDWMSCETMSGPRATLVDLAMVEASLKSAEAGGQPVNPRSLL